LAARHVGVEGPDAAGRAAAPRLDPDDVGAPPRPREPPVLRPLVGELDDAGPPEGPPGGRWGWGNGGCILRGPGSPVDGAAAGGSAPPPPRAFDGSFRRRYPVLDAGGAGDAGGRRQRGGILAERARRPGGGGRRARQSRGGPRWAIGRCPRRCWP